jgi:uncharacterized protein (TIGR02444 family)
MASELWTFTLDFYARPGVEAACLKLQASGTNVCALLCGVWLAHKGVAFSEARLAGIRQLATPWQEEVIRPLRKLRTDWKAKSLGDAQWEALRERLKALEVDAEQELLMRLEGLTQDWPAQGALDCNAWLEGVAGDGADANHDALQSLRVMAGIS